MNRWLGTPALAGSNPELPTRGRLKAAFRSPGSWPRCAIPQSWRLPMNRSAELQFCPNQQRVKLTLRAPIACFLALMRVQSWRSKLLEPERRSVTGFGLLRHAKPVANRRSARPVQGPDARQRLKVEALHEPLARNAGFSRQQPGTSNARPPEGGVPIARFMVPMHDFDIVRALHETQDSARSFRGHRDFKFCGSLCPPKLCAE